MENNLHRLKRELQNELINPTLSKADKQLWTLYTNNTLEQLQQTTDAQVVGRRKKADTTPKASPKARGTTKGKGKTEQGLS